MEGPIQSISLSLINMTSDVRENADSLDEFIYGTKTPSELLSFTDKVIEGLNKIDTSLSLINSAIAQMQSLYKQKSLAMKSWHTDLINQIRERKSKAIQLNTNVEIYSKENPLFKFECIDHFSGTSVGFKIVEVTKPEDYTVLSIINTLENVEPMTLEKADEFIDMVFEEYGLTQIAQCRTLILRAKAVLDSPEYTSTMATDIYSEECVKNRDAIRDSLHAIRGMTWNMKQQYNALFQTFTAIESNYTQYSKAIDAFSSVTLESVLDPNSVYEIM